MKILEVTKALTREGFDNYYFIILNNREKKYNCSIAICNKKIIRKNCECKHSVFEISRKVKTGKICRHIKFAIEHLKKEGIL